MYVIRANITDIAAETLHASLVGLGVTRMRLAPVNGYTRGCEREIVYRGVRRVVSLCPEFELEVLVADDAVDGVVGAIIQVTRTFAIDGYVTAAPIEQCYRLRTGIRES